MMKKIWIAILIILVCVPAWAQYVAQDPTRYVPNGRILGLGKAYIGLADDAGAMYTNPAGLGGISGWQLSSMSGKFLDEYTYLSFSGLYSTDYGVLGIGFAGTSISGAFATTIEAGSDPSDPIYVIDTTQPLMGNYNNAFILSYGNQMMKIPYLNRIPYADRMTVGANLKLFRVSLYGDGIVGGDASGQELDLGVKFFPPQKWMTFGATLQNLLPFSMGGKLHYTSGHEESYPAILELGSAFNILGKENAIRTLGDHELKLMLDLDYHPSLSNYPMVWHIGAEWKPITLLAIRMGLDQDAAGDGKGGITTISDMAYGVGLYFGGFRFDYAYHTFAGAPNITNSFFSLSYAFQPPPPIKEPIVVEVPPDKHITFESKTAVIGRVVDPRITKLTINGLPLKFGLKGDFSTVVDLKIGKNAIKLNEKKVRVLRLITFPDVKIGYWVDIPISLLAMQKIITGYPNGTFKPEGNITRAEMCTLLMKTRAQLSSPESRVASLESTGFKDVAVKHWAANYVAQAAKLGVVLGYPDGSFKPSGNITRAEGLAMIARFAKVSEEAYSNQFRDVASTHWAARIISGAYRARILEFLKGKPFEANFKLLRSETVEMLQRTTTVQDILNKDLLNWESY